MTLPLDRTPGATYALGDIGWIDFETRSPTLNVKQAGAYAYACSADIIVCAFAIDSGMPQVVAVDDFSSGPLSWSHPGLEPVRRHHARVARGEAIWCAWNSGFDKAVWNYATTDWPLLRHTHIIDAMAQASAAGLPPDLKQASRIVGASAGGAVKLDIGSKLIGLFCVPDAEGTPKSHSEEWKAFLEYAAGDIAAMRSVFQSTRQLPPAEWAEFFAMERINERGVGIDLQMVANAARLAQEDKKHSTKEILKLTAGRVGSVDTVQQMTQWLLQVLPFAVRDVLVEREAEIDEDGVEIRPEAHKLRRQQVEKLIAYCQDKPELKDALRVLQLRLYGGSKTPAKFIRMQASHVDGVLHGQYVFNGAGQTGRASSRGCQVHNLARDALDYELDAIDALRDGANYSHFAHVGGTTDPVARKLSLLIRPAFVPADGHVFVWSDWSQIEARILPWLAASRGGEMRLDIFREVDRDPSKPDLYTRTAAVLSHCSIADVTKAMRQRGKVAELALGYGGGANALKSMGAGYGLHLPDEEAKATVRLWREANQWCVEFWGRHRSSLDNDADSCGLWGAANRALEQPGIIHSAGRIGYVYLQRYLGGSLLAILPSGRCLTYRAVRYESVPDLDKYDRVIGYSTHLRFSRGYGRVKVWPGMLAENAVQAVAADILRGTLVRLDTWPVRLHTHDEVLMEVPTAEAKMAAATLRSTMREGFAWSKGLPLMSEETIAYSYSKNPGSLGL